MKDKGLVSIKKLVMRQRIALNKSFLKKDKELYNKSFYSKNFREERKKLITKYKKKHLGLSKLLLSAKLKAFSRQAKQNKLTKKKIEIMKIKIKKESAKLSNNAMRYLSMKYHT